MVKNSSAELYMNYAAQSRRKGYLSDRTCISERSHSSQRQRRQTKLISENTTKFPFYRPCFIFFLFFSPLLPSLADGMVGIGAVVGGEVGGWVGAGTITEKQGLNTIVQYQRTTQNQLCDFTSTDGYTALIKAGSI